MWICHICAKSFTKQLSHKRHIPYCRRTQDKPRARLRSCRSCNAAKVKCSFDNPCRRCIAKQFECVYEIPRRKAIAAVEIGDALTINVDDQTSIDLPGLAAAFPKRHTPIDKISTQEDLHAPDPPNGARRVEDTVLELPLLVRDEPLANEYGVTHELSTVFATPFANDDVAFDAWAWPYAPSDVAQTPWPSLASSIPYNFTLHAPSLINLFSLPQTGCLAPLRPMGGIVQHNTHLIVQALRAYPMMMLRRETFPPFIHPHWHGKTSPVLPESLSNCMGIAQVYAFRSEETKTFLWGMIEAEGSRFLAEYTTYSPKALLAALQAQIIYMIMRFVDGTSDPPGLNQQMMITYQLLCKQFLEICGSCCEIEQFLPGLSWEDWTFAESRRRTACLFFLICRCVSVDTGIPGCDEFEGFRELPLPSTKALWEAKTRAEWEGERFDYINRQKTGMHTMGMLIRAHGQKDDPVRSRLLDSWNCGVDNLGNLLNIAASMS